MTGENDMVRSYDFPLYDQYKASPDIDVDFFPTNLSPAVIYQLDPTKPAGRILSSKTVRQAFLWAADRESLIQAVMFGHGSAPKNAGIYRTYEWARNPSPTTTYKYDPKKAEDLLDADGWKKNPTTGIREKNGTPLKLELMAASDNPQWSQIAAALQANWKSIGADVTIAAITFSQTVARYVAGTFDIVINNVGGSPGFGDPDLTTLFHSLGGQNYGKYKNPQVDSLLDEGASTLDRAKRKDVYFKLQDAIDDDLPVWHIQQWDVAMARRKRLRGFGGTTYTWDQRTWVADMFTKDGK
jgi:peptide/nickel transport system substrate-binding protein